MRTTIKRRGSLFWLTLALVGTFCASTALAVPLPGGTLNPVTIPKYVQPLVIPPVMPKAAQPTGASPATDYNISVRQFKQQILPGGVWNTVNGRADAFSPTPIWSYGPSDVPLADTELLTAPAPLAANPAAYFNYPAFTVENTTNVPTSVRWINELVDSATGNYLPHLFANSIDQTLHWANPAQDVCRDGTNNVNCATDNPQPYNGPVPMVVHVHGSHVNAESDGYPEAWWLPNAANIPTGYAQYSNLFTQYDIGTGAVSTISTPNNFNTVPGSAVYSYENDQPAATIWYHDHTLGITRLNVYAGPAGFWLIRGGTFDGGFDRNTRLPAVLPGPAPVANEDPNFVAADRNKVREIPIVFQDRSFNADGTLFYPSDRAFFDGFMGPYVGANPPASDIAPIWNPEAFFNTMVVNGTTWPQLDVAPALYRFRLLNGCNSRFLNLAMFEVLDAGADAVMGTADDTLGNEIPFYQIGGDQGFLPRVVHVVTGFATQIVPRNPRNANYGLPATLTPAGAPEEALLMAPAERSDVIVDFRQLQGKTIRIINTAPDAPFGGFPDALPDADTTAQVMQFKVDSAVVPLTARDATTTDPLSLLLYDEPNNQATVVTNRDLTLNEEESLQVCVTQLPDGTIQTLGTFALPNPNIVNDCATLGGVPQAPKAALLGTRAKDPLAATRPRPWIGVPMLWDDPITENPQVGDTETWDIYNLTVDGHPIHIHLVRFEVKGRWPFNVADPKWTLGTRVPPTPREKGYKDTVLAYPGEMTRVKATFDLPGLYVWHCHILEHEDNEMMRPFYVGTRPAGFPVP